jgi:hypothetical protein
VQHAQHAQVTALNTRAHRDETTVLAFNGLAKVLRAHMATAAALPGFDDKWDEVCRIVAHALGCGRRSVAVAAAQLLTSVLQVRAAACVFGALREERERGALQLQWCGVQ